MATDKIKVAVRVRPFNRRGEYTEKIVFLLLNVVFSVFVSFSHSKWSLFIVIEQFRPTKCLGQQLSFGNA